MNYKKLYITFGFIILCVILWNYLIRTRLPREISMEVSNYTFAYYIIMCLVSLIILTISILRLYKLNQVFKSRILTYITYSLIELDIYVKSKYTYGSIITQEHIFRFLFKHRVRINYFYIVVVIAPKVIVTLCLIYDVIYLHTIYYFYKSIPIMLLPLCVRYLMYSLNNLYIEQLSTINKNISISCYTMGEEIYAEPITLAFYVENTVNIRCSALKEPFDCLIMLNNEYAEEILSGLFDTEYYEAEYKKTLVFFKELTELLITLKTVLYLYENLKTFFEVKLNIIVYLITTICWAYASYLCIVGIHMTFFYLPEEPFSGLAL